jgi:glycopeptide antibiotics resistance protein
VTAIVVLTLIPASGDHVVRLRPFDDIGEAFLGPDRLLLLETAANFLLFVPFGAALSLRGFSIGKTALSGLLLSAIVESLQLLFIPGRTTSLDDLLLNTLGALAGHAVLARRARDTS